MRSNWSPFAARITRRYVRSAEPTSTKSRLPRFFRASSGRFKPMRRLAAALWAVLLLLPVLAFAQSGGVVLTAQQIALYADRGLLVAQGGVAVRSPAFQIT